MSVPKLHFFAAVAEFAANKGAVGFRSVGVRDFEAVGIARHHDIAVGSDLSVLRENKVETLVELPARQGDFLSRIVVEFHEFRGVLGAWRIVVDLVYHYVRQGGVDQQCAGKGQQIQSVFHFCSLGPRPMCSSK